MLVLFLIILIILLIIIVALDYYNKQQIETKIVYANSIEPVTIDNQFSPKNFPSYVFQDMFESSTPWIGGTTIGKNALIVPTSVTPYSVLYTGSPANLTSRITPVIGTTTTTTTNTIINNPSAAIITPTVVPNLITTATVQ